MLTKQSIRGKVKVYINNQLADKDTIVSLSENWTEREEMLFRKMLKQGGKFGIQGIKFHIIAEEKLLRNDGEEDEGIIQLPGDTFI